VWRFLNQVSGIVGSQQAHEQPAFSFSLRKHQIRLGPCVKLKKKVVHVLALKTFKFGHAFRSPQMWSLLE
jgi:hypothetical protein